jgi:hypothetical protein
MDDKGQISLVGGLGLGPELALIAAYHYGVRNFWILFPILIAGVVGGVLTLTLINDRHFDEQGQLKTKHRKMIVHGTEALFVVLLVTIYVMRPVVGD